MTIVYIYIRHAEKKYKNGRGIQGCNQHDSEILESSIKETQKLGLQLITKFGKPNIIILSPYLRVVQTVENLKYSLNEKESVPMYIDTNIAEYLGNQKGPLDVSEQTLNLTDEDHPLPSPNESLDSFKGRVQKHLDMVLLSENSIDNFLNKNHYNKKLTVIWIVTHGFVINNVHDNLKNYSNVTTQNYKFYPNELGYLTIKIDDRIRLYLNSNRTNVYNKQVYSYYNKNTLKLYEDNDSEEEEKEENSFTKHDDNLNYSDSSDDF